MNSRAEEALQGATRTFGQFFGPTTNRKLTRCFVPGRIEVLGKHTDYAGGRSLLAATEQGVAVVSAPNGTRQIRLANADGRFPSASFAFSPELEIPRGPWTNYPMTVARRLQRNFGSEKPLEGLDLAFAGTLPPASGLSSSTSVIVGSFLAMASPNRLPQRATYQHNIQTQEDLATYLACIENGAPWRRLEGDRGVGTFGGSEDHTALLCCRPGQLAVFSFCPTRYNQSVPFPSQLLFVICHSGVVAEKTGPALEQYNAVSARARQACAAYNTHHQTHHQTLSAILIENARLPAKVLFQKFRQLPGAGQPPGDWLKRFRQFYVESHLLIPRATAALARGDLAQFGRLVDRSHLHSRQSLRNIVPETDWLQRTARALGAVAASAFGAGFGGSVYAVVPAEQAEAFQYRWRNSYLEKFPAHSTSALWLTTRPSQAAQCWSNPHFPSALLKRIQGG